MSQGDGDWVIRRIGSLCHLEGCRFGELFDLDVVWWQDTEFSR